MIAFPPRALILGLSRYFFLASFCSSHLIKEDIICVTYISTLEPDSVITHILDTGIICKIEQSRIPNQKGLRAFRKALYNYGLKLLELEFKKPQSVTGNGFFTPSQVACAHMY